MEEWFDQAIWKRQFARKWVRSDPRYDGVVQPRKRKVKLAERELVLVSVHLVSGLSEAKSEDRDEDCAALSMNIQEIVSKAVQTDEVCGAGRRRDQYCPD